MRLVGRNTHTHTHTQGSWCVFNRGELKYHSSRSQTRTAHSSTNPYTHPNLEQCGVKHFDHGQNKNRHISETMGQPLEAKLSLRKREQTTADPTIPVYHIKSSSHTTPESRLAYCGSFHIISSQMSPYVNTTPVYTVKKEYYTSLHCKKNIFKICYHNILSFVKSTLIIYSVEITYYFEFLMIKLIYFIVLTHFFQFNQLLRQPSYLL